MSVENKKLDVKNVTDHLGSKLYNFQSTAKALTCAWNANENLILYGPGGYAKSVGAEMFGNYLKDNGFITSEPYVLSFNQGITEEKIFGGMDVKKFQDTGEIIYLIEKAFVNHEYVIFEEMFDAFPSVLLSLKDVLTSGYVRNGNQVIPIKTKMIVGCTNRTREDVITDLSSEALLQRFIFEHEVNWSTHDIKDYKNAFKYQGILNDTTELIAEIVVDVNKSKELKLNVSPRTAVKAANAVMCNDDDITCLDYFAGFSKSVSKFRAIVEQRKKDRIKINEYIEYMNSCRKLIDSINSLIGIDDKKDELNSLIVDFIVLANDAPKSNDATAKISREISTFLVLVIESYTKNPISIEPFSYSTKEFDKIKEGISAENFEKVINKLI